MGDLALVRRKTAQLPSSPTRSRERPRKHVLNKHVLNKSVFLRQQDRGGQSIAGIVRRFRDDPQPFAVLGVIGRQNAGSIGQCLIVQTRVAS